MRVQADQTSRGVAEQARTMRDMSAPPGTRAKQIKLITGANVENSAAASALLTSVTEIRAVTDRNAGGVKQTRGGTDDLLRRARALVAHRRSASSAGPPERPGYSAAIGDPGPLVTRASPLSCMERPSHWIRTSA